MEYKLDYASWGSIFAVPCAVVDRHIRLCSGLSLKVLLWLLRNPEQSADPDALAKLLGYSAEDITDAIKYWADAGILTQSDDTGNHAASRTPTQNGPAARGVAPASDKDQIQMSSTQLIGKPRYSRAEVLRIIDGDKVLGELVHAAQPILGKPLTSVDMDILVALYSYYSLSAIIFFPLSNTAFPWARTACGILRKPPPAGWMRGSTTPTWMNTSSA